MNYPIAAALPNNSVSKTSIFSISEYEPTYIMQVNRNTINLDYISNYPGLNIHLKELGSSRDNLKDEQWFKHFFSMGLLLTAHWLRGPSDNYYVRLTGDLQGISLYGQKYCEKYTDCFHKGVVDCITDFINPFSQELFNQPFNYLIENVKYTQREEYGDSIYGKELSRNIYLSLPEYHSWYTLNVLKKDSIVKIKPSSEKLC